MMTSQDPMDFSQLMDLYRAEMKSATLTDVRKDLYAAMACLQENIRKEYEAECAKDPDSIMCEGKNERRKRAAYNVQRIIDLRMEKVARIALRASINTENPDEYKMNLGKLTQEEREYCDSVVETLRKFRGKMMKESKKFTTPDISSERIAKERNGDAVAAPAVRNDAAKEPDVENIGVELIEEPHNVPDELQEDRIMIRMLEDLPMFAGPDRDYDLRKEEVLWMPAAIAKALIHHEKAVLLNVTP